MKKRVVIAEHSKKNIMSINLKPHSLECGRNFRVLNFGSSKNSNKSHTQKLKISDTQKTVFKPSIFCAENSNKSKKNFLAFNSYELKSLVCGKHKNFLIFGLLILFIFLNLLNTYLVVSFLPEHPKVITGGFSGIISLIIEEWRFINITSPENITYSYDSMGSYPLNLNVSSNFPDDVSSWWYNLYDMRNNLTVNESIFFSPNVTIYAVRYSNKLIVFANRTGNYTYNKSMEFFINVTNSAPIIKNLSSHLYVCEDNYLSNLFNVTDTDEDDISVSLSPQYPFNPFYISSLGKIIANTTSVEIYSGVISKSDIGLGSGSKTHNVTVSASDDFTADCCSDSEIINITLIEINHVPVFQNISVITVWTRGEDNSISYSSHVVDVEDGNEVSGNLTLGVTFSNYSLFNLSSNGSFSYNGSSEHLGVHNVSICAIDNGLINPSQNISLCSQNGSNLTGCVNFSITVTNQNRAPRISSKYPLNLSFTVLGTSVLYFNVSKYDPDGTIPDSYWYVERDFKQYNTLNVSDEFTYVFGCGVSGSKNITVIVSDGELNASLSWNVSVLNVDCPVAGTEGGGGGGGGLGEICKEKWGCEEWSQCLNLQESYSGDFISEELFFLIKNNCTSLGIREDACGYQIRNCNDLNKCKKAKTYSLLAVTRHCYYTKIPTCYDRIKNCHDNSCEVLTDCSGPCSPCSNCNDGIKNQGEKDIDCGGPCSPCAKVSPLKKAVPFSWMIFVWIIIFILLILIIILFFIFFERKAKNQENR